MKTTPRAHQTLEFKREAVRLVKGWQSTAAEIRTLDVPAKPVRSIEPFICTNSGRPYRHAHRSTAGLVAFPPRGSFGVPLMLCFDIDQRS